MVRNLTPRGGPGKLRLYWELKIAEVVFSRYKNNVTYKIKCKSYPNKIRVLHRNILMPVNHLLDTIDAVPTIFLMKNKISLERKIKLHKQVVENPRETTSSSEESDNEYNLEFIPNQLLPYTPNPSHIPKKSSTKTTQY